MTLSQTLLSTRGLTVLAGFTFAAALGPLLEHQLTARLSPDGAWRRAWTGSFGPLLRSSLLAAFVVLVYPTLFGLIEAPSVAELLAGDAAARVDVLSLIAFAAALLLPAAPVIGAMPGIVLPVQSLALTAILFHGLTGYIGASSASVWPGPFLAFLIALLCFLLHHLAHNGGALLGECLDRRFELRGSQLVARRSLELLVQAPLVLVYGHALGQQIAI